MPTDGEKKTKAAPEGGLRQNLFLKDYFFTMVKYMRVG